LNSALQLSESSAVAFQGELGAYSQSAIYAFFGRDKVRKVVPLPTFSRVFENLCKSSNVDYAVVPIENSVAGSVGEVLDLLLSTDVKIIGEISIPIHHALLAQINTSIDQIRKVISHPQAIAQCKVFLDSKTSWQQVPAYDTAGAAKMIKEQNLKDTAAIASELAAEIYGLEILERDIEDDHSNQTRFVVITHHDREIYGEEGAQSGYKSSILFSTHHEPGALVGALSVFSSRNINLTKIESRPMKSRPWEYYFYVDFEGHASRDENCTSAIEELRRKTSELKVLGSYKRKNA
jgi:prephenate dehydratase